MPTLRRIVFKNAHKKKTKKKTEEYKIEKREVGGGREVVGREYEYGCIDEQVKNFEKHGVGSILYISGVPGSGKTHTVNEVVKNYKNTNVVYINCCVLNSKTQIYNEILRHYGKKGGLKDLRSYFINSDINHLVIIDEVDFLMNANQSVLYNLFELPYLDNSNCMIICLSNTLSKLSSKVESRIGKNRLEFKPYTAQQIEKILKNTEGNTLVKKFIAKKVASGTGDFRKAADLLDKNPGDIKEANAAIKKYYDPLISRFYNVCNYYQKILIEILKNSDNKHDILELYDEYKMYSKMNDIEVLNYFNYKDVLEDIKDCGFIKIKNRTVIRIFLPEELE